MEPPPAGRPAAPAPAAADALRPGQAPASEPAPEPPPDAASVARVQQLLAARDDTQRFVGLALLKALLDTSPQLRRDEQAVRSLWLAVSPAFLDRLLRTGSKPPADQTARHMLDLVVSLLHTFAALLPRDALAEPKLAGRAPRLVDALLYRYARRLFARAPARPDAPLARRRPAASTRRRGSSSFSTRSPAPTRARWPSSVSRT